MEQDNNLLLDVNSIISLLEKIGYFVEIVNNDGFYVYSSDFYNLLENISYENVVGKHITDVFKLDENSSFLLRSLNTGKRFYNVAASTKTSNGTLVFYISDVTPIIIDGKLQGAISISKWFKNLKALQDFINTRDISQIEVINPQKQSISETLYTFKNIIASSRAMEQVIKEAQSISLNLSSVLLVGETGTGKELFAQSIHQYSTRSNGPFVAINCSAIPATLLESILFGTSKGAFTGAQEKKGLFEEAENGTIFLDEINSMNQELQAKILRVLESRKVRRLGSNYEISFNCRIVSAMNTNPLKAIDNDTLRRDLFYRLSGSMLEIPPLRERVEDIDIMVDHFIGSFNKLFSKKISYVSEKVQNLFRQYKWPGNVRELRHTIEHALNIVDYNEEILQERHLPPYFLDQFLKNRFHIPHFQYKDYRKAKAAAMLEFEQEFITNALIHSNGNITKTANDLNVSRQYLHKLIKRANIKLDIPLDE